MTIQKAELFAYIHSGKRGGQRASGTMKVLLGGGWRVIVVFPGNLCKGEL